MRVLTAVFAQPGRVRLNVPGVVWPTVERGREEFDEAVASADQLGIHGRHGPRRTCGFGTPGNDAPGLRDRVDAAFLTGNRAQRRPVVVISAAIPVAVPGLALDGLLHGAGMFTPLRCLGGFAPPVGDGGELEQRAVQ